MDVRWEKVITTYPENTSLKENVKSNNRNKNKLPDSGDVKKSPSQKHWSRMGDRKTSLILEEMGMSLFDEDSQDECLGPTPPCYDSENIPPPQAPVAFHIHNSSPGSSNSNSSTENQLFNSSPLSNVFSISRKKKSYTLTGDGMINVLPDEVILAIFRWLPRFMLVKCACVCKRWYRLGMDESFWKRMDLANKSLSAGVLGNVLNRGVSILRLSKTEISSPIHTLSQCINSVRPCQLQYLDLSMAVIKPEGLEEIFARCTKLRKVSLENCQLTDITCQYIGQNRNIQVLNLSSCQNLTTEGLSEITSNCVCLESLNLAWTYLDRETVVYLVLCLPSGLLKLNLSGTRETLTDEDVGNLIRTCPHLKELDLSDALLLTPAILHDIVANLKGLEHIALSRCYRIPASHLLALSSMVSLMALDLFGTTIDGALEVIQDALPNVEINKFPFSNIARPTTGIRRTSIWGLRVRDSVL
ncbi:S-phase kinase-associated protein 2-like [Lineus longissimus]|uniref:S-phase kinase-associated protein 2-like n=1 Tax=Lineus longissimus TaxID=88925 RepID=UPI002B4C4B56